MEKNPTPPINQGTADEMGMSLIELTAVKLVQDIIKTSADKEHIEPILATATAEVQTEAIKMFRTSEKFRQLFPEFATYFDHRAV